jgi:uncharacterized membrane protein
MKNTTKLLAFNAVIAALYVLFTMPFASISFSAGMQIRISEGLTILPAIFPFSTWGVFAGCLISNIVSPYGIWDVVLGSLITLVAAFLTSKIKNIWLAPLPPILLNAFGLPLIWYLIGAETAYWLNVLSLLISQTAVLYVVGIPLAIFSKKVLIPKFFPDYLVSPEK